uniref:Uncharacterized protein n=1 Tax=Panagrolaimus sp. PS1159 TaxID=55785 RepID=A0AC35GNI6_9BILA
MPNFQIHFKIRWQSVIDKAHQTADKKRKLRKSRQYLPVTSMEEMAFGQLGQNRFQNDELGEILEDKSKRKMFLHKIQKEPKNRQQKFAGLIRNGMKLAYTLLGKNMTNFDEKNLKIMSPKLFSIFNEGDNGEGGDNDDPVGIKKRGFDI